MVALGIYSSIIGNLLSHPPVTPAPETGLRLKVSLDLTWAQRKVGERDGHEGLSAGADHANFAPTGALAEPAPGVV
jgi:hypothetical protein